MASARPEQLPPSGDWSTWLIMTGRGWGKTRTAAETVRLAVEHWGHRRIGLIGATDADVRDVMVEGESGLLSVFPEDAGLKYKPANRVVLFPNGAVANLRSADEPRRLRGLQFTFLWADEICAWRRPEAWDVVQFANRLRTPRPMAVVTTTPLAGHRLLKQLISDPRTYLTRGTMWDNVANLSPERLSDLERRYGGTQFGRQELEGELLNESEGALWKREWFRRPGFRRPAAVFLDRTGRDRFRPPEPCTRVVVALDPSVSDPERKRHPYKPPDACGIVVVARGISGQAYVLADFTAVLSPSEWAHKAVQLYAVTNAYEIVAEANQGGELIREVIRHAASGVRVTLVHARIGKRPRAEPASLLYEQGLVSHCGELAALEEQMVTWDPAHPDAKSPNNLDALVWGLHGLGFASAHGLRVVDRVQRMQH